MKITDVALLEVTGEFPPDQVLPAHLPPDKVLAIYGENAQG